MFKFAPYDRDIEIDLVNILDDPFDVPEAPANTGRQNEPAPSAKDDNATAFNDSTDDELMLSIVEDLDKSLHKTPAPKNSENLAYLEKILSENLIETRSPLNRSEVLNKWSPGDKTKHTIPLTVTPSKVPKIEYERKFPGPAGLIPKVQLKNATPIMEAQSPGVLQQLQVDLNVTDDSLLFESDTWMRLLKDLSQKSSTLQNMVDEFSIASVKRMNIIRNKSRKLPLFAAIIVHVDCTVCDPSVILKDPSGEIRGTLHKDLWEQHSHLLTIGTALLLRQVSVLSIANSRNLYLNVTSTNLVTIYTPQPAEDPLLISHLSPLCEDDFTTKTERTVFEETHPNKVHNLIPSARKFILASKENQNRSTQSVVPQSHLKPRDIESTRNFTPTLNRSTPSVVPQSSNPPTRSVNEELEGLDVDSIFGDF